MHNTTSSSSSSSSSSSCGAISFRKNFRVSQSWIEAGRRVTVCHHYISGLLLDCVGCDLRHYDIQWTVNTSLDWDRGTGTGDSHRALSIYPDVLQVATVYLVNATATQTGSHDSLPLEASYVLHMARPPRGGLCQVVPQEGVVMTDLFNVTCVKFFDPSVPLNYLFYLNPDSSTGKKGQLLHMSVGEPVMPPLPLPVGPARNNYTSVIRVAIADSLAASVYVDLHVRVLPKKENKSVQLKDLQLLKKYIVGMHTSSNFSNLGVLHKTSANISGDTALNRAAANGTVQDVVVKRVSQLTLKDMASISQKASCLNQLTATEQTLSETSKLEAVKSYTEMAKFLKNVSESLDEQNSLDILASRPEFVESAAWNETSQETGRMEDASQTQMEADRPIVDFLKPKKKMRCACWNVRTLYQTGKLAQVIKNSDAPVKDTHGNLVSSETGKLESWKDHFQTILNRPEPTETAQIPEAEEDMDVNTDQPTLEEVKMAIKMMKNGRAPGSDGVTAEMLVVDNTVTPRLLTQIFSDIWETENIPEDWKMGLVVKLPKKGDLSNCKNWRVSPFYHSQTSL
ncbi:hypothetical protein LSAT2_032304 [Lamellibrachia satsuma]|nr:hypothetical protein LSAT2_032304 [Lamellibrachia satsuma]